jgi:hypothetical protein
LDAILKNVNFADRQYKRKRRREEDEKHNSRIGTQHTERGAMRLCDSRLCMHVSFSIGQPFGQRKQGTLNPLDLTDSIFLEVPLNKFHRPITTKDQGGFSL